MGKIKAKYLKYGDRIRVLGRIYKVLRVRGDPFNPHKETHPDSVFVHVEEVGATTSLAFDWDEEVESE